MLTRELRSRWTKRRSPVIKEEAKREKRRFSMVRMKSKNKNTRPSGRVCRRRNAVKMDRFSWCPGIGEAVYRGLKIQRADVQRKISFVQNEAAP